MSTIRQRSLLARIEGQLAILARMAGPAGGAGTALHWRRIEWAGKALRPLLAAPDELARFKRLLAGLKALQGMAMGRSKFLHQATLLRADCVVWQLSLVHDRRQGNVISRAGRPLAQ